MRTRVNGTDVTFEPHPGDLAVDVIRRWGRTGTKLVCGTGVCGACTIQLDGRCVTSCILPARALDDADVRTIEGLAADGDLHPVQKAFIAADGLQCGFCTPGFVMEAVAFFDRWQTSGREGEPSREEIAAALSGHLCRCAAYSGISDAVRRACAGEFDGTDPVDAPRVEAVEKVTGRAKYTFDIQLEGQIDGHIVRSPHAQAVVESIDLDAARKVDGVRAVVRLLRDDDPHVRFVGQPVVAFAARTREAALAAARALDVRYRPLPAVLTVEQGLAGRATAYTGGHRHAPNSAEGPVPPAAWDGNVRTARGMRLLSVRPRKARALIARARDDDDLELASAVFVTSDQIHTALEPHCAVARWPSPDSLEVWVSTQTVELVRTELAKRFTLRRERVTVIAEHIGGGFGAKQGLQDEAIAAVKLSRAAGGVPVRVANGRHEEMTVGGYRPGTRVEVDMVARRDGTLEALRMHATSAAGVAVNSTVAVLSRLVYPGIPKDVHDRDVVTNLPPGKPFRAPFGPPFFFAMESSVDQLAHQLGRDPLEVRRAWDGNPARQALYPWGLALDVWRSRRTAGTQSGRFRRGVGAAIGGWLTTFYAGTEVEVTVTPDGITATTAIQDMGTGSRTVLAQAVADELGVKRSDVRVSIGVTGDVPGTGSSASRTTNAVLVAGRNAARALRAKLPADWRENRNQLGTVTARGRRGANGPFDILGRLPTGSLGTHIAPMMTGALYICELIVDTRLGRVTPTKFWAGIAAGRIVAPTLARHQIEGAIIQGIGYSLFEERSVDPVTGIVMNLGLEEFRIPGIGDTPDVEVHFHEAGFEKLKGQAAGLSELATVPVAATVANAVFNATGRRFTHLPLRPGRILEGLS